MVENKKNFRDFTVYLDGVESRQGNVLARSFVNKLQKLIEVLSKLERVHQGADIRKMDFEIIETKKFNPTTITLKAVPTVKNYDPIGALNWSVSQLECVAKGSEVDDRLGSDLLKEIATLATPSKDQGFNSFWINGHADPVRFDEEFELKAKVAANKRRITEKPMEWFTGKSLGEVIGTMKRLSDLGQENEGVIVPVIGPARITCVFDDSLRDEVGKFWNKKVRLRGVLHYSSKSPHPHKVTVGAGGVEIIEAGKTGPLFEMTGLFAKTEKLQKRGGVFLNG